MFRRAASHAPDMIWGIRMIARARNGNKGEPERAPTPAEPESGIAIASAIPAFTTTGTDGARSRKNAKVIRLDDLRPTAMRPVGIEPTT